MISFPGQDYTLTNFLIADAIDYGHMIAASGRVDRSGELPDEALAWMLPEGDLVSRTRLPVPSEDNNDGINYRNASSTLDRTAKHESLLKIGWKAKLMVTVEKEYRIGGRPIWKKFIYTIFLVHILDSHVAGLKMNKMV
jgi:hypothetical protein